MNTIKYIALYLISVFLLMSHRTMACMEEASGEYTRIASFYRIPNGMESYLPFIYTFDSYYGTESDPLGTEKMQIIDEWQSEIGTAVVRKDIEMILYQVTPNMFLLSYIYNKLNFTFEGNTFIQFLTKPQNTIYLNYVVTLKQTEYLEFYLSDRWNEDYNRWFDNGIQSRMFIMFCNIYLEKCKSQLPKVQKPFLNIRYHFQLAKMLLKTRRFKECEDIAQQYLSLQPNSILNNGILHYLGVCSMVKNDTALANLYFARSFRLGNERKFRNMQLYYTSAACVQKSLLLTSNRSEKALLIALAALRNPGHALNQLKLICNYDKNIPEFLFLMYREINKFDDWIACPTYTDASPTICGVNYWDSTYKDVIKTNLQKDKAYLNEFKTWLNVERKLFNGESRQYMDLAYMHLCLLKEDYQNAFSCFKNIHISNESPYYGAYKGEEIYLKITSPNFNTDANLNNVAQLMKSFEPTARHDEFQCKMLASLNMILAYKMNKIGRKAYAGLIRLKADRYAGYYQPPNIDEYGLIQFYTGFYYDNSNNYDKIDWFDHNARISDVDTLIKLSLSKNKMVYQQFFSDSTMGSTDLYRDLKGNMAYRTGNLKLATATYCQINPAFWNNEEIKTYLCEDPFIPKYWPSKRNFHYKFSKANFTTQLLNLEKQTLSKNKDAAAQAWLKLGHAYYNTTWWGNAWMMCEYYRGSDLSCLIEDDNENRYKTKSAYYNCSTAKKCYLNVLNCTKDKELNAAANFMLFACDMNNANLKHELIPYDKQPKNLFIRSPWLINFAQKFQDTKVYREYLSNCSNLKEYIKKGYLKL